MLSSSVPERTRPTYSSMSFGLLPADEIRTGASIKRGMGPSFRLGVSVTAR
jgi:hypothetical protein